MIKDCKCEHEYQDKRYGKNKRVHNELAKEKNSVVKYRCTVCGEVKT